MSCLRLMPLLSVCILTACTDAAPQPVQAAKPEAPAQVASPAPINSAASNAQLTRIEDPSTVCMINDQHMGVAQIPVNVEGKTYYGCCQACEAKLKSNVQARLGLDPVTQSPVDKATAVLAKDSTGKVLYFENEANMQAYASRM